MAAWQIYVGRLPKLTHVNINYFFDVENGKRLPFLVVITTRKADGSIGRAVDGKPMHTNMYLNTNSQHYAMLANKVLIENVNQ